MNGPARPFGVTAAAVVALLGSLLVLLFAALMFTTAFIPMPEPQVPGFRGIALGTGAVMAGLAALGVATALALLKMRPWARTAAIAFAVILVILGAFGVMIGAVMPMPTIPGEGPADAASLRAIMLTMFFLPVVVGAWWLVQFNRQSVKAAFESGGARVEGAVPVSVLLTGWISIVGGVACLLPIVMRMPAFLFGVNFEGVAAGVIYAVMGAVSLYIGRGLLALDETARRVCIAWYAVTALHTGLITFVPSMKASMLEAQARYQPELAPMPGEDAMMLVAFVGVVLLSILAVAFLHRHRALFRDRTPA